MKYLKGFSFRLKVRGKQDSLLSQAAGCRRWVWNQALEIQKSRLDSGERLLSYAELCTLLPNWKREEGTEWLKDAPSQTLQQGLKDLTRSLKESFQGKGFPKFKRRGNGDGFRFPQGVQVSGRTVILPKLGRFKFFKSREIIGEIRAVSIVRRGYHWHISFQCEITEPDPIHPSSTRIGIDLGIKRLATLSDGTFYPPQNNLSRHLSRLAFEQRKLSRKQKRSKNWRKQKQRLAKLHAQIADTRRDYLHKITTEISKNHAVVCVEDLQVSQMSGSSKRSLNRAILDQGWYEFRRQLEYKLKWRGGLLILVGPEYTSQTCPSCGHIDPANRPSQSRFECVVCPYTGHADVVGATNILAVGHTVSACGDTGPMRALAQESSPL